MQFLNAGFLWAGFAVLIPLIIHLFNFRRFKTVYFSDVRFLQNLKNSTRHRSVLKHLLILAARILIIASLVFAFAEPVISTSGETGNKASKNAPPVIYIDNSFSMMNGKIEGLNLENAKNKALEIAGAFDSQTPIMLITNGFLAQHNRLVKADGIRDFLQKLSPSPKVPTLGQVIEKSLNNLNLLDIEQDTKKNIFIISDFQKSICDFNKLQADSNLTISLIPIVNESVNNIYIDTAEFLSPQRMKLSQEEISVTIANLSNDIAKNVPIKLYINGSTKCAETTDINAGEKKQITLKYVNPEKSLVKGRISITDFPVSYDNDLFFSYKIDTLKKVLIIGENNSKKYFNALFGKDNNFKTDIVSENQEDINFNNYQSVILNSPEKISRTLCGKIINFVSQGGNVVFVPSFSGSVEDYNYLLSSLQCNVFLSKDTLKCKISKFNDKSPLLRNAIKSVPENVEMPVIKQCYNSSSNSYEGEDIILESDSYKKILSANQYKGGRFYVFYSPLNEKAGNLVTDRLIVPILYNAVTISQNYDFSYYSVIGKDNGISVKLDNYSEGKKVFLKQEDSLSEFIPRLSGPDGYGNYKVFSEDAIQTPGFYDLTIEGQKAATLAYNYDKKESDLRFENVEKVADDLNSKGFKNVRIINSENETFALTAVKEAENRPLWKVFIILALLFGVCEILICRFL